MVDIIKKYQIIKTNIFFIKGDIPLLVVDLHL